MILIAHRRALLNFSCHLRDFEVVDASLATDAVSWDLVEKTERAGSFRDSIFSDCILYRSFKSLDVTLHPLQSYLPGGLPIEHLLSRLRVNAVATR